ncbi:MAG: hypothetical protein HW380_504 [Magnetococcales bacterium]|nr:hypothetical protein [Magnetococcales bacterium]HIJ85228.1 hypothetical protein [Magnetococcales bacterium]
MDQNKNGKKNGNKNGQFMKETCEIMLEINMLYYSLAAIENDMEMSIQKIRKTAAAFSEPRRQRLRNLILEFAQWAGENRATLIPDPSQGRCFVTTPAGSFGFAPFETMDWGVSGIFWYEISEGITIPTAQNVQRESILS